MLSRAHTVHACRYEKSYRRVALFCCFLACLGVGRLLGGLHVALGRQMHGVRWHEAAGCILHRNLTGASHFSAVFWPVWAWGGSWAEVLAQ